MLKRWRLAFNPDTDYFQFRHLWVLLPGLPLHFWTKEVIRAIGRVPIQLLPSVGRVIHGAPEREGDCHGKVSITCQSFQAEDSFHLMNGGSIASGQHTVDLVDDGIDARYAILRTILLDGVVPFNVGKLSLGGATAGNTSPKQIVRWRPIGFE